MTIDKEALGKNPDVEDSNGINTEEKSTITLQEIPHPLNRIFY